MTENPENRSNRRSRTVFTVSRLNQDVNGLLELQFGMLWVEGELSNFSKPASGHYYFSLKDTRAQIRCAMFRGRNQYIAFTPQDGQQVLLRGKLGIYEARGDFQFIVEHMEPAGAGLLQQKFEDTKNKLNAAGWFDPVHKRQLPAWPDTIGVITSPTGAAIRDILHVLSRRYSRATVIVYPTTVQGAASAPQICQAIKRADSRAEVDVLILARGGGSIEDLWAFNDEVVARAVFECHLPLVCGVGHEIDFTIADMVADLRAPTPSAAAELVAPDTREALARIKSMTDTLRRALRRRLSPATTLLTQLTNRLQHRHPEKVVAQQYQRTDELEARLLRAFSAKMQAGHLHSMSLESRLNLHSPARTIERYTARVGAEQFRLISGIRSLLKAQRASLSNTTRALDAVSPLATLSRGYAVIRQDNKVLTNSQDVKSGDQLEALLAKGRLLVQVKDQFPE